MPETAPQALFSSYQAGALSLQNRVLMSPMTRCRSEVPGEVPNALMAEYYRQRATAGLIFTEATHVSANGLGYFGMPGIFSEAQREGWKPITQAVHDAGGVIYAQLFHCGRVTHPELIPGEPGPVAPSAVPMQETVAYTPTGKHAIPTATPLNQAQIPEYVAIFKHAAQVAQDAGFDGVQLHGANGYLIDEFLRDGTNQRDDAFGGNITNRLAFPMMVLDALIEVWGTERVGLRVSPTGTFNEMSDTDPLGHFTEVFKAVQAKQLGHLEVVGQLFDQPEPHPQTEAINAAARKIFTNTLIFNGDYNADKAEAAIAGGHCDLVTFGRPFLANPDLPRRLQTGADLAEVTDPTTLYNNQLGAKGYTDYPALDPAGA